MSPVSGAINGEATVTYLGQEWALAEGVTFTFGRVTNCDIRIGAGEAGPIDQRVSRQAGSLTMTSGRVRVRNLSSSNPLYVYPSTGSGYVMRPSLDEVSPASEEFRIVIEGAVRRYELLIATVVPAAPLADAVTMSPPTQAPLVLKTERERQLLAAFCERLLTRSGTNARPLSYREAAERLGVSEHYLKNKMKEICDRQFELGLPGMGSPDAKDELCRLAVWGGVVSVADLTTEGASHSGSRSR